MRWHAIGGLTAVVLVGRYFYELPLPLLEMSVLIGLTALSNVALVRLASLLSLMLIDIGVLTAMLALSGGAGNPFVAIYLANIALAAFLLPLRQAVLVMFASIISYGLLLMLTPTITIPHELFQRGLAFAVLLTGALVFVFTTQLKRALQASAQLTERHERIAVLGAFAAEAAHELGSPLGTIAVAANEIEGDDAQLIRDEVDRCQRILQRTFHRAGQLFGEAPEPQLASEVARTVVAELSRIDAERVDVAVSNDAQIVCPQLALQAALANLVTNALQSGSGPVVLRIVGEPSRCRFVVEDSGAGMSADALRRAGEPFFSTKPGEARGLGLFLTRAFAERTGGVLQLQSTSGKGTVATLEIPGRG